MCGSTLSAMPRVRVLVVALVALLATVPATACGDDKPDADRGDVAAATWAGQVCAALAPWRGEIDALMTRAQQRMDQAANADQAKTGLLELLGGAENASEQARAKVAAAGLPDAANGKQRRRRVHRLAAPHPRRVRQGEGDRREPADRRPDARSTTPCRAAFGQLDKDYAAERLDTGQGQLAGAEEGLRRGPGVQVDQLSIFGIEAHPPRAGRPRRAARRRRPGRPAGRHGPGVDRGRRRVAGPRADRRVHPPRPGHQLGQGHDRGPLRRPYRVLVEARAARRAAGCAARSSARRTDFFLDGQRLRLWCAAAGETDRGRRILAAPGPDEECWKPVGRALAAVGLPATLLGPRAGGPLFRIEGRKRVAPPRRAGGRPAGRTYRRAGPDGRA